jgi:hypothetical protein
VPATVAPAAPFHHSTGADLALNMYYCGRLLVQLSLLGAVGVEGLHHPAALSPPPAGFTMLPDDESSSRAQRPMVHSELTPRPRPLILGVHGHASAWFGTIGGGGHPYNDIQATEQLDMVQALGGDGVMWYRIELNLPYPFNYQQAKEQLSDAAAFYSNASKRGIRILPMLLPTGLMPGDSAGYNVSIQKFHFGSDLKKVEAAAAQVAQTVSAFLRPLGSTVFGIGGEWNARCLLPNGDGSKAADYNLTEFRYYLAVLHGMHRGTKQACQECRTQVTSDFTNYGFNDLLESHGFTGFDIVAYDWYSDMGDLDNTSSCVYGNKRCGPGVNVFQKLLSYNKSIWIGELNRRCGSVLCDDPQVLQCRNSTALQQEADYLSHELTLLNQLAMSHPQLEAVFVYQLFDQPDIEGLACGKPKGSLCGEGHCTVLPPCLLLAH